MLLSLSEGFMHVASELGEGVEFGGVLLQLREERGLILQFVLIVVHCGGAATSGYALQYRIPAMGSAWGARVFI